MNIVNKFTIRQLIYNKKRTLVTLIGVMISVALLTAVTTLGASFLGLMQRQAIATEGNWHVLYKDVNKDQLEAIRHDASTKELVISEDGYALLKGSQAYNRPYLFIKAYNTPGFKDFPIELSAGRLPRTANELVISEDVALDANVSYTLGDHVTLDVGKRVGRDRSKVLTQKDFLEIKNGQRSEILTNQVTETYTIVGFIKPPKWDPGAAAAGFTAISYLDENSISMKNTVDVSILVKKINQSLFTHAELLAETNQIKSVTFNTDLLQYYGVIKNDSFNRAFYYVFAIIMIVILIGSVSLIYNSFAISVSERTRHLGMLSSIGATSRQKRNSVFFEAAIIGMVSIPLGIISGLIGITIIFWFLNGMMDSLLRTTTFAVTTEKITLTITPLSVLIAAGVSMMTIFISAYLPAKKASSISVIDAIRQTNDIKLTGKTVRTSMFIRKLFGIEAEIGLKNLKRNKRRYYATVISLIISIVLFLTVSYFTSNVASLFKSTEDEEFDISVYFDQLDHPLIKLFVSLEDVTGYSLIAQSRNTSWINRSSIPHEMQEWIKSNGKSLNNNGQYQYDITINALEDEELSIYAKEVGADYQQLKDPNDPSAIVINTFSYEEEGTYKAVQLTAIHAKVGDTLELDDYKKHVHKVKIAALTNQTTNEIRSNGFNIVISKQVLNQLNEPFISQYLYLKSKDPLKTEQEIRKINRRFHFAVQNMYEDRKKNNENILLIKEFGFGFAALITVISMANVFNTISTSISLRRREFAMLRSMGMEQRKFTKMINYESIVYGITSLAYGIPISIGIMYVMYRVILNGLSYASKYGFTSRQFSSQIIASFRIQYGFMLPWASILVVIAAVFMIVCLTMLYAGAKVKKINIIEALNQENI